MKMLIPIAVILLLIAPTAIQAQSLSINTDGSTANASAMLDVKSTVKGLLIPRMTRTERNTIASPATGLMIFQSGPDSSGFYYYTGSRWIWMFSVANSDSLAWKTSGNAATVDANNFIGTTDNIPFNIRVNNQKSGRIDHINWNSFYGYQAGNLNSSGIHNTAVGYLALTSNLSGTNNTVIGTLAANANTTGDQNTATGYGTMYQNTVGIYNTAYGFYALFQNVAGSNATAIGVQSMLYANNTTTPFINNNVAVGYESLKGSTTAANNTGLGNTAIGYQTLFSNSSGLNNSAQGFSALYTNTTGNNNSASGYRALYSNSTGDDNTATGTDALFSNTTAGYNTANGFYALRNNTLGTTNTAIGATALYFNTTASMNTAIGYNSLYTQSFSNGSVAWNSYNTAIGDSALFYNQPTTISNGYYNTAIGNQSLRTNTTGYQNTAVGSLSLYNNTVGQLNTAMGWASLYKSNGGVYNTAHGAMAMYYNVSGGYNVAIGTLALHNNVTGSNNTVIGDEAGLGVLGNSYANNTMAGYQAGYNLTTGSNNVFIGNQAGFSETSGSNKLYIANSSANPPLIYGDFSTGNVGIGTVAPTQKLHVVGNICYTGSIAACSDARYKTNIVPISNSLGKLMMLQGINYDWKTKEYPNMNFSNSKQIGFLAQDLEKVFPEMVFTDDAGYKSIDYSRLTPVLVETIKEQQKIINDIIKRVEKLEKK